MSKKYIASFVLSLFFLNTLAYTSLDIAGANYLASKKIIKDWSSNPVNYRFNDNIARSEIMGMILAMKNITRNATCRGDFADVPKSDTDWVCRTVETAADEGFINADPVNGKIRPYANVSRSEALGILFKAFDDGGGWAGYSYYWDANFPIDGDTIGYKDSYNFAAEWQARVFYDYIRKVLKDDAELSLNPRPSDAATRAAVFEFARKVLGYKDHAIEAMLVHEAHILPVPFSPQAPTGDWSDPVHSEACEETSIIMANTYFSGHRELRLDPQLVETEIAKLVEWQDNNLGYHLDSNAVETAQMAREVYGLQTRIVTDYTEEDLKTALRENKVIIYFTAGRILGNPDYRSPGPLYHVVVIK